MLDLDELERLKHDAERISNSDTHWTGGESVKAKLSVMAENDYVDCLRNNAAELIRLARIGQEVERKGANMQPLIGLTGYAGSGKDTAAKALIADGWTRVAFADAVRECALALNPILLLGHDRAEANIKHLPDGCQIISKVIAIRLAEIVEVEGWKAKAYPEIRELIQRMGTEVGRNIIGENVWVDIAELKIEAVNGPVIVTDVRFENEVEMIRRRGGKIIRVRRPGVEAINGHASEAVIDKIQADAEIVNNGSEDRLKGLITGTIESLLIF